MLSTCQRGRRPLAAALLGVAAGLGPAGALAQSAVVLAPLNFGALAVTTAGTVTISPGTGSRQATGGVLLIGSSAAPALIRLRRLGSGASSYSLALPADGSVRLTQLAGTATMPVDGITASDPLTGTVPSSGTQIYLGATLKVAQGQAPGSYSGSIPVTVHFN